MRHVGLLGVGLWVVAMACVGGLLYLSRGVVAPSDLADYGLVFLGYVVVSSLVARRCIDVSMIIVAMWGAAVGYWAPRWYQLCNTAMDKWGDQAGLDRFFDNPDTRTAVAIAAAGVLTAALLYLSTRSVKVVAYTVVAGSVVAAIVRLPIPDSYGLPAAVVAWNAIVAAGMCGWMGEASRRRCSGRCPRCGGDVEGLTSPVCPSCAAMITSPQGSTPTLIPIANRRPV